MDLGEIRFDSEAGGGEIGIIFGIGGKHGRGRAAEMERGREGEVVLKKKKKAQCFSLAQILLKKLGLFPHCSPLQRSSQSPLAELKTP